MFLIFCLSIYRCLYLCFVGVLSCGLLNRLPQQDVLGLCWLAEHGAVYSFTLRPKNSTLSPPPPRTSTTKVSSEREKAVNALLNRRGTPNPPKNPSHPSFGSSFVMPEVQSGFEKNAWRLCLAPGCTPSGRRKLGRGAEVRAEDLGFYSGSQQRRVRGSGKGRWGLQVVSFSWAFRCCHAARMRCGKKVAPVERRQRKPRTSSSRPWQGLDFLLCRRIWLPKP